MRSHKPHKGSYLNLIKQTVPVKLLNEILSYSGTTEEQAEYGLSIAGFKEESDDYYQYVEGRSSPLMELFTNLNYIKKSPTDIVLDRSVKDYLESIPLKEKIHIPDLEKGVVWIDLSSWGLTVSPDIKAEINPDEVGLVEKVKGLLVVKTPETQVKWEFNPVAETTKEMFAGTIPPYWCHVHASNGYFYTFPMMSVMPFKKFISLERRYDDDNPDLQYLSYTRAAALGLTALEMIYEGQFVRDTSVFQDSSLPSGRQKIKSKGKSKRARFKQKYRQFRTTYFRHQDSEPKKSSTRNYTPPEHYTPRNVRSHYKERWVTLDYVEKHQVVDDDILDIEDKTKLYKTGENTKTWVKIKLWFEFTQDPELEPSHETERYRV